MITSMRRCAHTRTSGGCLPDWPRNARQGGCRAEHKPGRAVRWLRRRGHQTAGDAGPQAPGGMAATYRDLAADDDRTRQIAADVASTGTARPALHLCQCVPARRVCRRMPRCQHPGGRAGRPGVDCIPESVRIRGAASARLGCRGGSLESGFAPAALAQFKDGNAAKRSTLPCDTWPLPSARGSA
jgi:hypothetical protein